MRSSVLKAAGSLGVTTTMLMMGGCVGSGGMPPSPTAPPARATVVVAISDVAGLEGGGVATILFRGGPIEDRRYDVATPEPAEGLGGFGALVDADPFAVTSPIMVPDSMARGGLFPYVTDEPLLVEPGTYTLYVWADTTPLGPFGRWIPGSDSEDPDGIRACETTFDVESEDIELSINGVPLLEENTIATCELD